MASNLPPPHQHAASDLPIGLGPGTVASGEDMAMALSGSTSAEIVATFKPGAAPNPAIGQFDDFGNAVDYVQARPQPFKKIILDNSGVGFALMTATGTFDLTDVAFASPDRTPLLGHILPFADGIGAYRTRPALEFGAGSVITFGLSFRCFNVDVHWNGATALATVLTDFRLILENSRLFASGAPTGPFFLFPIAATVVTLNLRNSEITRADRTSFPQFQFTGAGSSITGKVLGTSYIMQRVLLSAIPVTMDVQFDSNATCQDQDDIVTSSAITRTPTRDDVRPPHVERYILTRGQLELAAGGQVRVRQGVLLSYVGNAVAGDDVTISDGTTTETWTYVAGAPGAFEIQVGGTKKLTLTRTVAKIVAESAVWTAEMAYRCQRFSADGLGYIILRATQSRESFADRVFGNITPGAIWNDATGHFDYGDATVDVLPTTDPGMKNFGFGTLASKGSQVYFAAQQGQAYTAQLGGVGTAVLQPQSPSDYQEETHGAGGVVDSDLDVYVRTVRVVLAGATLLNLTLPSAEDPAANMPVAIRRDDGDVTSTFNLVAPAGQLIDGAPSIAIAVTTGTIVCIKKSSPAGWFTLV